jgi:hypothetical protein
LEAALLIGCETIPVDEQDYASEAEELADLLADNRLSELAELDEDDLRRVLKSIADADPDFDIELTGFMEDEIRKLMDDAGNPEDELETIPRMECQAFETQDYLVFMFHDLRDWMQVLQLMGVSEVDYSIRIAVNVRGPGIRRIVRQDRPFPIIPHWKDWSGLAPIGPNWSQTMARCPNTETVHRCSQRCRTAAAHAIIRKAPAAYRKPSSVFAPPADSRMEPQSPGSDLRTRAEASFAVVSLTRCAKPLPPLFDLMT